MADGAAEWVKFWGGLAGLATFAFTVWDRALRSRLWIEPHILIGTDAGRPFFGDITEDAAVCLRVYNPGPKAIGLGAIRFYPRSTPPPIELWDDVGREVHPRRLLPVAAGETRLLRLIWRDLEPGEDPERTLWAIIPWRPLSGVLPRVPLILRTSIAALGRLQDSEIQAARAKAGLPDL